MIRGSGLSLGKGKNMSIPKAALIYFYEHPDSAQKFLTWGDLEAMHDIVTIAGAQQISFLTPAQVIARLRGSSYWYCDYVKGFYSGITRNGGASCCEPSDKGKTYYEENLKGKYQHLIEESLK